MVICEIELPSDLQVNQQYGRVAWGVRAIYESYTGWFRYESTTELYPTPPSPVYPEPGELVGVDSLGRGWYRVLVDGVPVGFVDRSSLAPAPPDALPG